MAGSIYINDWTENDRSFLSCSLLVVSLAKDHAEECEEGVRLVSEYDNAYWKHSEISRNDQQRHLNDLFCPSCLSSRSKGWDKADAHV